MKDSLIEIKSYLNYAEANLAKGMLEANGIDAELFDENIVQTVPLFAAQRGIRLMVREEDVEDAKELLSASFEEE